MVMVTGGAFQGKISYASSQFKLAESDIIDGSICPFEAIYSAMCIKNYHELVRRLGNDCIAFTQELCRRNPSAVIIIDEIGCGIIPLEKSERTWRENVGRCGCIIASNSVRVVRMVCGIPNIIKDVTS
ncbi:MAG: bifunctional adenosylcobinamide kinase/adenosylcobinamide-phosphate guanylyltransferase [Ruminococcus sp.]|nr:bifunctional adenosylcobinamide kinase/adenosylcobinamide-phosphate guanylyltransferase [Ruminococcus sp.]